VTRTYFSFARGRSYAANENAGVALLELDDVMGLKPYEQ